MEAFIKDAFNPRRTSRVVHHVEVVFKAIGVSVNQDWSFAEIPTWYACVRTHLLATAAP